jgi:hypothetical protein
MKEPWQLELERTVHFLNTATDVQSRKLWAVLTALRGPDSDDSYEKYATTSVIRHAIGLRKSVAGAIVNADSAENAAIRMNIFPLELSHFGGLRLRKWTHFSHHVKLAFEALGLVWDKDNSKEKP